MGIKFDYSRPGQADRASPCLILGRDFVGGDRVALILGDNVFYGHGPAPSLPMPRGADGATVFAYYVNEPANTAVKFDELESPST
jgi:glucose-1-phosphate thymidylyltransferase